MARNVVAHTCMQACINYVHHESPHLTSGSYAVYWGLQNLCNRSFQSTV